MIDTIPVKEAIDIAFEQEGSRYELTCKRCHNIVVKPPNKLCRMCAKIEEEE